MPTWQHLKISMLYGMTALRQMTIEGVLYENGKVGVKGTEKVLEVTDVYDRSGFPEVKVRAADPDEDVEWH